MAKVKKHPDFYMARPKKGKKRRTKIHITEDLCDLCNKNNVPIKKLRQYREFAICMDCIKDLAKEIKQ